MDKKIIRVLKALLVSYVVTGILLFVLSLLLYKFGLTEQIVATGIVVIYVISTFVGGVVIGKMMKVKKFVWGLTLGVVYFALLLLISLAVNRGLDGNGANVFTSFLLCAGGGMFGGMIS